jgi:hypothetical protein
MLRMKSLGAERSSVAATVLSWVSPEARESIVYCGGASAAGL